MPLFFGNQEVSDGKLIEALLAKLPTKEITSSVSTVIAANAIRLFNRQAVFLNTESSYQVENSATRQALNTVYIHDVYMGLIFHIRDDNGASYTAVIDPFTKVDWDDIIPLFTKDKAASEKDKTKIRLTLQLGYIKPKIKAGSHDGMLEYLAMSLLNSLQASLKDKAIIIVFDLLYKLNNEKLRNQDYCANIIIDVKSGLMSTIIDKLYAYYPITLYPIDKSSIIIKECDYTSPNQIVLIYNRSVSMLTRADLEQFFAEFSTEFKRALSQYNIINDNNSSYLNGLMNYFKTCLTNIFKQPERLEEYFITNYNYYKQRAILILTATKIFTDLVKNLTPDKEMTAVIGRKRSASDGNLVESEVKVETPSVTDQPDVKLSKSPTLWRKSSRKSLENQADTSTLPASIKLSASSSAV